MFTITPFHKELDRKSFDCGNQALNQYITTQASQDIKRNLTRCFVASPINQSQTIAGFYTLGAFSVSVETMPEQYSNKLPRYPVPCALLGRLAIDQNYQRQGLGKALLADAIKKLQKASEIMAVYALIVEAKDVHAVRFYRQFGLVNFQGEPKKLFMVL